MEVLINANSNTPFFCKNGERVLIKLVSGTTDQIEVTYKGQVYKRNICQIGTDFLLKKPDIIIERKGLLDRISLVVTARDSKGFDSDGFDQSGYDREGYDREGYDHDGKNRLGFNKNGYNERGYNAAGYNAMGYDRDGFNRIGYNSKGFDQDGYNREGYDREGYDRDGYDRAGYNALGYDRSGFNRAGYNSKGFDQDGYNRDGYDREGYDRDGYDRAGYNAMGYDRDGFNRIGYNSKGFDRDGYNRAGYDKDGYGRDGYNTFGYGRDGFNRIGYNSKGFDRDGYNREGYDREGYGRDGYNRQGLDRDGFYRDGMDIRGYNRSGFNLLGFDQNGIAENGSTIYKYLGYKRKEIEDDLFDCCGYDKDGYDKVGFDIDGYDRNGFDLYGRNRKGFDRAGYDIDGYDSKGFDASGFNRSGFDAEGYDQYGFDQYGYDRNGYDKDGRDINGNKNPGFFDAGHTIYHKKYGIGRVRKTSVEGNKKLAVIRFETYGYEAEFDLGEAFKAGILKETEFEESLKKRAETTEEEEKKERSYWKKVISEVQNMLKQFYSRTGPKTVMHALPDGEVEYEESYQKSLNEEEQLHNIVKEPYFAHVDHSRNHSLYIGKKRVGDLVVDWADPKAKYYYEYRYYIGSSDVHLNFVRNIDFCNGIYAGYVDLYNESTFTKNEVDSDSKESNNERRIADDYLNRILARNRANKQVHDIISSIQQNQYAIISEEINKNIIVLGCAGSGKTMILMHRLRFLKYNNQDLDMRKVFVVSPTEILSKENAVLSFILGISEAKQMTVCGFYYRLWKEMLSELNIHYPLRREAISEDLKPEKYELSYLQNEQAWLSEITDKHSAVAQEYLKKTEQQIKDGFHAIQVAHNTLPYSGELMKKYDDARQELKEYSALQALETIRWMKSGINNVEDLEKEAWFIEFLLRHDMISEDPEFTGKTNVKGGELVKEDADVFFNRTKEFLKNISREAMVEYENLIPLEDGNIDTVLRFLGALDYPRAGKEKYNGIKSELSSYKKSKVEAYLIKLKKRIRRIPGHPWEIDVLSDLVKRRKLSSTPLDSTKTKPKEKPGYFSATFGLYQEFEWKPGDEDPMDIMAEYAEVNGIYERLKRYQRSDDISFLMDAVINHMGCGALNGNPTISTSDLFAILWVLREIFNCSNTEKRLILIDEFQDFSVPEYLFIKNYLPNSAFNLFGDCEQMINGKGLKDESDIGSIGIAGKVFHINENYRNPKEVTEYVNEKFGVNMMPIGPSGRVSNMRSIEITPLQRGDRAAIIVKDEESFPLPSDMTACQVYRFSEEKTIRRNAYTILSVNKAKGLEFEKVIAVLNGMERNEAFVACTRALDTLEIVEN